MDKKYYLAMATHNAVEMTTGAFDDIFISFDYSVPFKSNVGHFTTNLTKAMQCFTIADFKQLYEVLSYSNDCYTHCELIHNYLVNIVKELARFKADLFGGKYANERNYLETLINRYKKMNEVLVAAFGFDPIAEDAAPKYKKCDIYTLNANDGTIEIVSGFQFVVNGYTLQVYKDNKRKICRVTVPSCGLFIKEFTTGIKTAHQYIDELLLANLKADANINKIMSFEKMFIDAMNASNIEIPEACKPLYYDPSAYIEDNNADISMRRFARRFSRLYDDIYNDEAINGADYSEYTHMYDNATELLNPLINALADYRQDFISSDREAAAFILALIKVYEIGYRTIEGVEIPSIDDIKAYKPIDVNESIEADNEPVEVDAIEAEPPYRNKLNKLVDDLIKEVNEELKQNRTIESHEAATTYIINVSDVPAGGRRVPRVIGSGPGI